MQSKTTATCSICGKEVPLIDACINVKFEEERCRECMERYGPVPLETLRAALTRFDLDIIKISQDDRDELVALQKEKIALNRETDKTIEKLEKGKWVFRREKKTEKIKEAAKKERDQINQEIDTIIENIKDEREAESRKPPAP